LFLKNEGWKTYRQMLLDTYPQKDAEETLIIAAKQAYMLFFTSHCCCCFEGGRCTPLEALGS